MTSINIIIISLALFPLKAILCDLQVRAGPLKGLDITSICFSQKNFSVYFRLKETAAALS